MFSFEEYREIVRLIKASGIYTPTYEEALKKERFILMRHDVEYSVARAFQLSRVEESLDFRSCFFFQWTNNSYNILSRRNRDILMEMHARGQTIGLHFALNGMTDMALIRQRIEKEAEMLSDMLGFPITCFSIHRPSRDVLKANLRFDRLINAYQDDFFSFAPDAAADSVLPVKYFSDANHIWRYGYPDEKALSGHDKIQILTHPFAWTRKGYANLENYRTLVNEKYAELIDSIDSECKDFNEFRDGFETPPFPDI